MNHPINIVHIDTGRDWRGGEQQAFYLVRGLLQKTGFNQKVIAQPGSIFARRVSEIGVDVIETKMRGEIDPSALKRILQVIKDNRIDLVHVHDAHAHSQALTATAFARHVQVIVTRRVDFQVGKNIFSTFKYKNPRNHYIAISSGVRQVLIQGGISSGKIDLVHSGIDPERFKEAGHGSEFKRRFQIDENDFVIGNIGALVDHKGQIYLINAAPRILESIPNARIFILGEGELRSSLKKKILELGLGEKVHLPGYIENIGDALNALDLFVLSSHLEGLCTSLLDAMLMRVPVVATNTGGVPDAVIHGKTGLLAEPQNPAEIADAVIEMHRDPELRSRLVGQAYRHIMENFTVNQMVEGTAEVYRKVMKRIRK